MIKYLGSKRTLLAPIAAAVASLGSVRSVIDPFSGTARVGHALKGAGYQVFSGDHNRYAAVLARCYVQANRSQVVDDCERLLAELETLPGRDGWFVELYCRKSRYFQPHNGERIQAMRDQIAAWALDPEREAVLLVALMEAADRVDSTTGVQMAYLKQWASRSYNPLQLRMPAVLEQGRHGPCQASEADALTTVQQFRADVAYLDPPYNQHKYLGNYHVWETLMRWDQPQVYGVAQKRADCRERQSDFNSRVRAKQALQDVIDRAQVQHFVVSFSDEGYLSRDELIAMLSRRGEVQALAHDFRRYVGAQIGIYNPAGEKVGKVSHLRNTEWLFVVRG